jgi:hypothetical protein
MGYSAADALQLAQSLLQEQRGPKRETDGQPETLQPGQGKNMAGLKVTIEHETRFELATRAQRDWSTPARPNSKNVHVAGGGILPVKTSNPPVPIHSANCMEILGAVATGQVQPPPQARLARGRYRAGRSEERTG